MLYCTQFFKKEFFMFQFLKHIQAEFPNIHNIRVVLRDIQTQQPCLFAAPDDIILPAEQDSIIRSITCSCYDSLTVLKPSSKYNQMSPYQHHVVIKSLINTHQALYCVLSSKKSIKFKMQMQLFKRVHHSLLSKRA